MATLLYLGQSIDLFLFLILILLVLIYVRIKQGEFLGNALQISEIQFPKIYKEALECKELLGLKRMPPIYVTQNPLLNAFAMGLGKRHVIILHSAIVENLTLEEIKAVIGHEMGHILLNHTNLLSLIAPLGSSLAYLDILLGFWLRRAEYSCDRCALICVQDRNIMYSTLVKIAVGPNCGKHVDIGKLSSQLQEVTGNKIASLGELFGSHPYIVKRLWRISQFSSEYNIVPCPNCGSINKNIATNCTFCGNPLLKS